MKDTKKNLPRLQIRHEGEGERGQNPPDPYLGEMSVLEIKENWKLAHQYKRKGKFERTG